MFRLINLLNSVHSVKCLGYIKKACKYRTCLLCIIFNYTFHSKDTHVRGMLFFKSELMVICLQILFKRFQETISNIFEQAVTNAIGL